MGTYKQNDLIKHTGRWKKICVLTFLGWVVRLEKRRHSNFCAAGFYTQAGRKKNKKTFTLRGGKWANAACAAGEQGFFDYRCRIRFSHPFVLAGCKEPCT